MALKLQKAKERKEESSTGEQQLIHTHPPAGISSTEGKILAGRNVSMEEPQALLAQKPPQANLAHRVKCKYLEDRQVG